MGIMCEKQFRPSMTQYTNCHSNLCRVYLVLPSCSVNWTNPPCTHPTQVGTPANNFASPCYCLTSQQFHQSSMENRIFQHKKEPTTSILWKITSSLSQLDSGFRLSFGSWEAMNLGRKPWTLEASLIASEQTQLFSDCHLSTKMSTRFNIEFYQAYYCKNNTSFKIKRTKTTKKHHDLQLTLSSSHHTKSHSFAQNPRRFRPEDFPYLRRPVGSWASREWDNCQLSQATVPRWTFYRCKWSQVQKSWHLAQQVCTLFSHGFDDIYTPWN